MKDIFLICYACKYMYFCVKMESTNKVVKKHEFVTDLRITVLVPDNSQGKMLLVSEK